MNTEPVSPFVKEQDDSNLHEDPSPHRLQRGNMIKYQLLLVFIVFLVSVVSGIFFMSCIFTQRGPVVFLSTSLTLKLL